jgi:hypothetical protein
MPNDSDLRSCSCSNPRFGGDEYITLQLLDQHMVFQLLPAEIEKRLDMMVMERFDESRIDAGVYNDAHAS